jgi:P pilus assembly chaperone PapD
VKRRLTLAIAAVAAFGLIAGFATNATAYPTKTVACSGCHSGPALTVTATQTSNNGVTAAYNVTAPGAYYIAVFDGSTKVAQITGASGTAALTVAHTYTLRAVEGPTTSSGYGQLVVTPVAPIVTPPADTVAPVTTSDALSTYVSSAAIHLTATDNAGGSGVAATYYILDGGAQTTGTLVNISALGSHTLKFWSVDVAGNVEAQKTASFTITSPVVVVDTIAPVTTSNALSTYVSSAAIHLTATDNAGGSGVAATYYILDGGAQTAGTVVTVGTVGDHTLAFWSVDVAGNVEAQKTASFSITAPVVIPEPTSTPTPGDSDDPTSTPAPVHFAKVTVHVMGTNSHDLRGATVKLVDTTTGKTFTVKTDKHGNAVISHLPYGTYSVTATSGRTLAKGTLTVSKSRVKMNLRVRNVRSMHKD